MTTGTIPAGNRFFSANRTAAGDPYLAKLAKYVPVEALAPFVPLAASAGGRSELIWATFVVSLLVGAVLIVGQGLRGETRPRWWFWPFTALAFVAWAIGASNDFRELLGVDELVAAWFLGVSAAALPALDMGLELVFPRE